ncbi:MAG: CHAP domain-containing protein [Candidatus Saccharibacteria bacterium]
MSSARRPVVASKQQLTPIKPRPKAKVKIKSSVIAIYASAFVLIVAIIFLGYHAPQGTAVAANVANVSSSSQSVDQTSVDNVVATNVAANVAQTTNLPIATSVANLAISAQAKSEFTQSDGVSTAKPQLIVSSTVNRSISNYTAKAGDTVDTLSAQFGISKDTIKWANNLTSDTVSVGTILRILPVNGVLYTVKSSDTIDSIATKYGVDKTRLVLYNDLDVSGLTPNTSIILPNATLPADERPGYVAPVVINYYAGLGTGFGGNTWNIGYGTGDCPTYSYGQCTCYAYSRRIQLGLPVGGNWGNASSWAYYARAAGYTVNTTPSVGAIMQNGGGFGHVAIVESILPNGDLSISEMNAYVSGGGWNIVSGRIVSAGNVGQYWYIH